MASRSTLNSRLRILVAKAFRAEKLYSTNNTSRSERLTNVSALNEAASEIRAKEWQKAHYYLRTSLNEILNVSNNSTVVQQVSILKNHFTAKAEEGMNLLDGYNSEAISAIKRNEYAHVFRLSIELIRVKAQIQASRVISDELTAVLDGSEINAKNVAGVIAKQKDSSTIDAVDALNNAIIELNAKEASKVNANVINISEMFKKASAK
ncbi:MAG: hypothetical protein KBC84_04485 [Proteobacteria bacterium]|nr:hypothetical protein [Pseudomonadota bacterium]